MLQRVKNFFSAPSYPRTLALIGLLILLAVLPVTVIFLGQQTNIFQHAYPICYDPVNATDCPSNLIKNYGADCTGTGINLTSPTFAHHLIQVDTNARTCAVTCVDLGLRSQCGATCQELGNCPTPDCLNPAKGGSSNNKCYSNNSCGTGMNEVGLSCSPVGRICCAPGAPAPWYDCQTSGAIAGNIVQHDTAHGTTTTIGACSSAQICQGEVVFDQSNGTNTVSSVKQQLCKVAPTPTPTPVVCSCGSNDGKAGGSYTCTNSSSNGTCAANEMCTNTIKSGPPCKKIDALKVTDFRNPDNSLTTLGNAALGHSTMYCFNPQGATGVVMYTSLDSKVGYTPDSTNFCGGPFDTGAGCTNINTWNCQDMTSKYFNEGSSAYTSNGNFAGSAVQPVGSGDNSPAPNVAKCCIFNGAAPTNQNSTNPASTTSTTSTSSIGNTQIVNGGIKCSPSGATGSDAGGYCVWTAASTDPKNTQNLTYVDGRQSGDFTPTTDIHNLCSWNCLAIDTNTAIFKEDFCYGISKSTGTPWHAVKNANISACNNAANSAAGILGINSPAICCAPGAPAGITNPPTQAPSCDPTKQSCGGGGNGPQPTPTPACVPGQSTSFALNIKLPGIGLNSLDNSNPAHPTRNVSIAVKNEAGTLIYGSSTDFSKTIIYGQSAGKFASSATNLNTLLTCGHTYQVEVKVPGYVTIKKNIAYGQTQTIEIAETDVIAGDIVGNNNHMTLTPDNRIAGDDVVDVLDYNIMKSCRNIDPNTVLPFSNNTQTVSIKCSDIVNYFDFADGGTNSIDAKTGNSEWSENYNIWVRGFLQANNYGQ